MDHQSPEKRSFAVAGAGPEDIFGGLVLGGCAGQFGGASYLEDSRIRLEAVEGWAERNATPFVLSKVRHSEIIIARR